MAHLRAADPVLARVIDECRPLEVRVPGEPYEHLMRAIIYQQLAGAAAATIERRFRALYGGRVPSPAELLATPDDALRGAGVSRQKAGYLRDLARHAAAGLIDGSLRDVPDDAVITRVTAVKGVGRWTADMLLLFCLSRPDVLPVGDLGIRRAIQRAYRLPELPRPAAMEQIAAPWQPHRSIASRYLWHWLDTAPP